MVEKLRPPRTDNQREIDAWRRDQNDDNSNRIPKVTDAEPGNVPTFTEDGGIEDNDIGVEDIQTYFDDGSIFYADNGFPAEDVSNFSYDDIQKLLSSINIFTDSLRLNTALPQSHIAGQISYDPVTKTNLSDTGISDVRVNIGQEIHARLYNDTGTDWGNGQVVTAGPGVTDCVIHGTLASSSTLNGRRVGVATSDIPDGSWGLVVLLGEVRGIDTSLYLEGQPLYLDSTPGEKTTTKPLYPEERVLIGYVTCVGELDGIIFIYPFNLIRLNGSRSYSFTSNGIGAGTYYSGGYYEAPATDVTLTEASPTFNFGLASVAYCAHAFAVFSGPGTVDAGQVGLKITGTSYDDDGTRIELDSEVITEDITTLSLNDYLETEKKWLGQIEYGLYIAAGTPTVYSVTFNYGFAKYEDLNNNDFTVIGYEAIGLAGANDIDFNMELLHHKSTGWTHSAAAFIPGNGIIISFSDSFAPEDNIANNVPFAWKRTGVDTFIEGSAEEGVITRITCGTNNSVQSLDIHVSALLEGLPF